MSHDQSRRSEGCRRHDVVDRHARGIAPLSDPGQSRSTSWGRLKSIYRSEGTRGRERARKYATGFHPVTAKKIRNAVQDSGQASASQVAP